MKRTLSICLLVALLQSCSWVTSFFIANKSSRPITITYRYMQYEASPGHTTCSLERVKHPPEICQDEDKASAGSMERCRTLRPDEFRYDKERCEVELTLASGEEVEIGSVCCSYTGNWEKYAGRFDVLSLTIRSPSGLVHYEGGELLKAFKKVKRTRYVLYYQ